MQSNLDDGLLLNFENRSHYYIEIPDTFYIEKEVDGSTCESFTRQDVFIDFEV